MSINVLLGLVSLKKYIYTKINTASVPMALVEVQRDTIKASVLDSDDCLHQYYREWK